MHQVLLSGSLIMQWYLLLIHLPFLPCRYQTPSMKTRQLQTITAIVPAIERPALEGAPFESSSHTQPTASVGAIFFNVAISTKTPKTHDKTRLTNIKNCRSHRSTQSRLKSLTKANSVDKCVAVDRRLNIHMMKKWYGTIVSILVRPTLCMPIP
jgi:hypothetical protein